MRISPASLGRQIGFTLMELLATATVVAILASATVPLVRNSLQRQKELELRRSLREMRVAIDNYKKMADAGQIKPPPGEAAGYPESLEILVEGTTLNGKTTKIRFLRRIPVDPFTGTTDWGMRSINDDPNSTSWGGGSVFDVYSKSQGTGFNQVPYKEW